LIKEGRHTFKKSKTTNAAKQNNRNANNSNNTKSLAAGSPSLSSTLAFPSSFNMKLAFLAVWPMLWFSPSEANSIRIPAPQSPTIAMEDTTRSMHSVPKEPVSIPKYNESVSRALWFILHYNIILV
jgi:hypothetical protein